MPFSRMSVLKKGLLEAGHATNVGWVSKREAARRGELKPTLKRLEPWVSAFRGKPLRASKPTLRWQFWTLFNTLTTRAWARLLAFVGVFAGLLLMIPIGVQTAPSQDVYRSFDLIYYSRDSAFAGRSNFREPAGKRELSTEQRLQYLDLLAARLVREAGPLADAYVIDKAALDAARAGLAPLPLPKSRAVQPLVFWSWQIDIDNQAQDKWSEETFDDSLWNPVKAPYVRDVPADLWFRTRFTRPANPRVYLEAEQILDDCRVWVNGRLAGRHQGYGPFRLDITELLKRSGDNVLAIQIPWKQGEQVGLGGRMNVVGLAHQMIENPFFYTEGLRVAEKTAQADVAVECEVRNTDQAPFTGTVLASLSPTGQGAPLVESQKTLVTLKPGEVAKVRLVINVPGVRLWTPEQPNLYEARLVLADSEGAARDDIVLRTGIRRFEQKNGRFFLNNRPFFMVGFLDTLTYPPKCLVESHGEVAPADEQIIQTILAAKKANANILRLHPLGMRNLGRQLPSGRPLLTGMTDATNYARYAEIADQLGITLVWPTRFWGWQVSFLDGDKERQLKEDLPASIEWVRNHPSIVAYEGMNEVSATLSRVRVTSPGAKAEAQIDRYSKIRSEYIRTVSQVDPTRLINPDSSWASPDSTETRLEPYIPGDELADPRVYSSTHLYEGWYRPFASIWMLPALANPKSRDRAFVVHELGSEAMPNWALYEKERWYGIWMNNSNRYCSTLEGNAIGRPLRVLDSSEYLLSQAYQALLYYVYATATRNHGGDGFTICALADGFTQAHYHKGALDVYGRAKLGWVMARIVMDDYRVTGTDGDLILCPSDPVQIRVSRIGPRELRVGRLKARLRDAAGETISEREFRVGSVSFGVSSPIQWAPGFKEEGFYFLEYELR